MTEVAIRTVRTSSNGRMCNVAPAYASQSHLQGGTAADQHEHCCGVHMYPAGAREGHESYRFLSTAAALDMLAATSSSAGIVTGGRLQYPGKAAAALPPQVSWLLEVLPELAEASKAGLNTMQPNLAAHMLLMLQR